MVGLVVCCVSVCLWDGMVVLYMLIGLCDVFDVLLGGVCVVWLCLLLGYGGFVILNLLGYSDVFGIGWFECGGVMVFVYICGGGEFGLCWYIDV